MTLTIDSPAAEAAVIEVLRILAARGRALRREAAEDRQPEPAAGDVAEGDVTDCTGQPDEAA